MKCLEINSGDSSVTASVCHQQQGTTGAAPTSAPTAAARRGDVSVPGGRRLSGAQAVQSKCLYGSAAVACNDGVHTGDES